ncbi:Mitochondrial ATPase complex subunit ATP10 [Psilocybe cubensis]|uniref:Mitochondrial ATPase complex subunit ATP10 n=2 Tax=Psilocybe cubensis TaxID=181762 RepID=A0A8H8CKI8_PSICU|nr:Mitochondrial ATPase complex subunit ATP10 [Psilocybe cubensis]KAH9478451.1 Mitochondrial ATPase complex subunit ATP10 [Psilocybe cubensis]
MALPLRFSLLARQPRFSRTIHISQSLLKEKQKPATQPLPNLNDPPRSDQPLPPLNRPLGVRQRPTTVPVSRMDRVKSLMDTEALMAQRRHLIKEVGKGYFHDLNMTRRHGGKTWIAPKVLIREDKALYLPNVSGSALNDGTKKDTTTLCYGKITVLAMLGTNISEAHARSFAYSTNARYQDNPLYQYVQINLQENLLKSFLVKLFSSSLRSSVPAHLQPTYLVSSQNMEYVRDPLGMTNSKVGYVYLIDENLKIRWGGSADATLEEAQSLESCTGVLLKRLEERKAKAPKEDIKS